MRLQVVTVTVTVTVVVTSVVQGTKNQGPAPLLPFTETAATSDCVTECLWRCSTGCCWIASVPEL